MRLGKPKYTTGYRPDLARVPHQDPRAEAQIQQVLSRYAAIRRTEDRLAAISAEQERIEKKSRRKAGFDRATTRSLTEQAERLHEERMELEAFISNAHVRIGEILAALGDDALFLGSIL